MGDHRARLAKWLADENEGAIMSEANIIRIKSKSSRQVGMDQVPGPRFLSLRQVLDRTSISRSLVYQLIKDEKRPFPAPVHIGRRSVWVEGEVNAYIRAVIDDERVRT